MRRFQRHLLPLVAAFTLHVACVERGDVLVAAGAGNAGSSAGVAGTAGAGMGGSAGASGGTAGEAVGGEGGSGAAGAAGSENSGIASDVSAGDDHACAIVGGVAYCWGNNGRGQLGLGDQERRIAPAALAGDRAWRRVAAGTLLTCGLDVSGGVFCWGDNRRGALGVGDRSDRSTPAAVALPEPAIALSSHFKHACALLQDDRLFCWGTNDEGQLGQDDPHPGSGSLDADALSPVQVPGEDYRTVDTGQGHTCAITGDGALYCWGRNTQFVLGTGSTTEQFRTPVRVGDDSDWLEIAAGQSHTCAMKLDGSIWCWGSNSGASADGGAPLGIEGADVIQEPTRVGSASDWTRIRSNTFHTCSVKQSSELWCWGRNVEGQLGLGDTDNRATPVLVGSGYGDVSAGRFTTCALTSDGAVRCAGRNETGELGTGDTDRRDLLTDVTFEPR